MAIESIPFGNTQLKVTKLGLGLAALGRPGYINLEHGEDLNFNYSVQAMQENTHRIIDLAYTKGIRYFDVARSYGKAESFLSGWLRQKEKKDVTIGSKWGYTYTAGWKVEAEKHEIKEHSLEVLNRQWKESVELLGNYLNIYQIHSASLESGVLESLEVLERLWELKDQGIVIGLSLSGSRQGETLKKALSIKKNGRCLFQSVQATWNVLEQSTTNMLEQAAKEGFGIIIKEALANGQLTSKNNRTYSAQLSILDKMAQKYETTIDALSIAYVLHQPWVSTVLSGATTASQLLSNLKSLEINLSSDDMAAFKDLSSLPEEYWDNRSQLSWN